MTKFSEFMSNDDVPENIDDLQQINGVYGCQSCDKDTYICYFDEQKGEMMWFCEDGHKSFFTVM